MGYFLGTALTSDAHRILLPQSYSILAILASFLDHHPCVCFASLFSCVFRLLFVILLSLSYHTYPISLRCTFAPFPRLSPATPSAPVLPQLMTHGSVKRLRTVGLPPASRSRLGALRSSSVVFGCVVSGAGGRQNAECAPSVTGPSRRGSKSGATDRVPRDVPRLALCPECLCIGCVSSDAIVPGAKKRTVIHTHRRQ